MKTETIFYCEGPDCERHVRTAAERPMAFIQVSESAGGTPLYFCGWDCVMKHGATYPPETIVTMDPPEPDNDGEAGPLGF